MPDRSARLAVVSGVGGKQPACFLLEAHGARILLDLGEGPEPGIKPDVSRLGRVDALILSHAHIDHAGALDLLPALGDPPVHATAATWAELVHAPVPGVRRHLIPVAGSFEIAGIRFTAGRCGHAPGGVWLHAELGGGFLYTGDWSVESNIYPFDVPPPAATMLTDASYGDFDEALADQVERLLPFVEGGAVLPVPPAGRGPEVALHLMRLGLAAPFLCPVVRRQAKQIALGRDASAAPDVRPAAAALLAAQASGVPSPKGVTICTGPNAEDGLAARLLARWRGAARFVFTGHVPPGTPAAAAIASGEAAWHRWNVHPRMRDVIWLAGRVGARRVLPAFVAPERAGRLAAALAPAEVLWTDARMAALDLAAPAPVSPSAPSFAGAPRVASA